MNEGRSETAQTDKEQPRSQSGSLLVTFIGGALLGASAMWTGLELQGKPQGMSMSAQQGGMAHETKAANIVAVDDWAARPTLDTAVYRDPGAGWNLNVITTNFTFDAQSAGLENVEGHGHACVTGSGDGSGNEVLRPLLLGHDGAHLAQHLRAGPNRSNRDAFSCSCRTTVV